MMDPVNKRHWYDGFIYDKILAPNQKGSFGRMSELIGKTSNVLDIGCGTGRLAFRLGEKCASITGIDLSDINIATAETTRKEKAIDNITFIHTSLSDFLETNVKRFDFAILSYIMHEVSQEERIKILSQAASVSENLVISDHKPATGILARIIREVMEFFAGPDHYNNYRSYIRNEGITSALKVTGLKVIYQETYRSHLQITVLKKE